MVPALLQGLFNLVPLRYVVWFLGFWGMFHLISVRTIMGLCLVAMTVQTHEVNVSADCPYWNGELYLDTNENQSNTDHFFHWSQNDQSQVLSAYFYGFTVMQFLSGVLCIFFSPKWLVGIGTLFSGVFSLLSPVAADSSLAALMAVRVLLGLASGFIIAPLYLCISRWSTFTERGMCLAFLYLGTTVGIVVAQVGSGYLIAALDNDGQGWKYPFYVFGGLACLWFVLWIFFVSDFPKTNSFISSKELNILELQSTESTSQDKVPVPWISILTSVPFWALVACNFSHNWGLDLLQMQLPNYFKNILHFNITKNGIFSSLPFLVKFLFGISSGVISTWMQTRFKLSTNFLRKFFTFLAYYGAGAFILGLGFAGCTEWLNIFLLCSSMGLFGLYSAGVNCTFVDMAPRFSAILLGVSNAVANIAGFACPILTGYFVTKGETLENWRYIFLIASGWYIVTCTIFLLFGSSNLQPWAEPPRTVEPALNIQSKRR